MAKHSKIVCGPMEYPFRVDGSEQFIDTVLEHPFWEQYVVGDVVPATEAPRVAIVESDTLIHGQGEIHCDTDHVRSGIKYVAHNAETTRQEAGQYTVHGNVIALGKRTVALIGGVSGVGKTSLAAHAANTGWTWLSDEKFAVNDQGEYVAGLHRVLADEKSQQAANGLLPQAEHTPARPIDAFVIPILTTESSPTIHTYDADKANYHYYEELGRNISAGRALMPDYPFPLESADSRRAAIRRVKCAQYFATSIPMIFARGYQDDILSACEAAVNRDY